jgi:hypothetical protein
LKTSPRGCGEERSPPTCARREVGAVSEVADHPSRDDETLMAEAPLPFFPDEVGFDGEGIAASE